MELKVQTIAIPDRAISFNYDELKVELEKKAEYYESLAYTPDQIAEAKADRASLNKLKKALNDERIKRERDYMLPFADFKAKINEIIRIIDKPATIIDRQIKEAEMAAKEQKRKTIHDYFEACKKPENFEIVYELIYNPKWDNASAPLKMIQNAIDERIAKICEELEIVRSLPEYEYEAEEIYRNTLDLTKALAEPRRIAEFEARKKAVEDERKKAVADSIPAAVVGEKPEWESKKTATRNWVAFKALLSEDEARALGKYLRANGIQFAAI